MDMFTKYARQAQEGKIGVYSFVRMVSHWLGEGAPLMSWFGTFLPPGYSLDRAFPTVKDPEASTIIIEDEVSFGNPKHIYLVIQTVY